jgi:thiol:disulfide interchange protein DsbD
MGMKRRIAIAIFSTLVLPALALTQTSGESPVHWSAKPPVEPVRAGAKFEVKLEATIDDNWHMYSATQQPPPIATRFKLLSSGPFEIAGAIKQSQPKTEFDPNFGIPTEIFAGGAEFWVPISVAVSAKPGDYDLSIQAYYQVCDDKSCLPPKGVPVSFKIKVAPGSAVAPQAATGSPGTATPLQADQQLSSQPSAALPQVPGAAAVTSSPVGTAAEVQRARASGFLPFLWLAMTMGALSLATPCVFPMIPITVSYFTKSAETNRASGLRLALVYCLGIIFTFTGLGLGLAAVLGATGLNQFAANPWVNLLITAVFLGFALNLFGLYQIGIPASVLTRLSKAGSGSGYASTLLMGLTFTLTSFTCTVPFVGTVLVATSQGDWLWPAMGMLGFSVIFAAPFFVLALVPRLLVSLPKSGGWLNSVKVTMGFLEVAAAMKFISNVDLVWRWHIFTREVVLSIWLATCVLTAIYLLGKFRLPYDSAIDHLGVMRMTAALVFLAMGFYLFTGLMGASLGEIDAFLPPRTAGAFTLTGGSHGQELSWHTDLGGALAQARQERKLVFVDFTGYTCTNCRWMEANTFTLPDVYASLQKYVRLQLYTDGDGKQYEENQAYQKEKFGTVALPLYAVLDAQGNKLATFPGMTRDAAEFVRFLNGPLAVPPRQAIEEEKQ